LVANGKGCPIKSSPKGSDAANVAGAKHEPNTHEKANTQQKTGQAKSLRLSRTMRDIPATAYRMPNDGRKTALLGRERKQLADFLATFADADGSRIFPSVETIATALDRSRATIFRRLDDLCALGVLGKEGYHGEHGSRIRRLRPEQLANRAELSDSDAGVQDTDSGAIELAGVS
jgi:hypothetical protein